MQLEGAILRCLQREDEDEEAELVRQCPTHPTLPAQYLPLPKDSLITMMMMMVIIMMAVTVVMVMMTMVVTVMMVMVLMMMV